MASISYIIDEDTRVELIFNRETITAHGYMWDEAQGEEGEDDYQPDGMYFVSDNTYSGYTPSECIILSLMDIGRVDDWTEGIAMIEAAGIPYVSSDDCDCGDCQECGVDDTRTEFEKGTLPKLDK